MSALSGHKGVCANDMSRWDSTWIVWQSRPVLSGIHFETDFRIGAKRRECSCQLFTFVPKVFFVTRRSTVWTTNDELSGILWKPPETDPRSFQMFCLFVGNRGDTIQYNGGLRSRELGQAPMLQVVLTPRQGLSSKSFISFLKRNSIFLSIKTSGNLLETYREPLRPVSGGFQRFWDNPSLTDHILNLNLQPSLKLQ